MRVIIEYDDNSLGLLNGALKILGTHMDSWLDEKEPALGAKDTEDFLQEGLRIRRLVHHVEGQREVHGLSQPDAVRPAFMQSDPPGQPGPLRAVPDHLQHFGLKIGCNDGAVVSDESRQAEGGKPSPASNVDYRHSGLVTGDFEDVVAYAGVILS